MTPELDAAARKRTEETYPLPGSPLLVAGLPLHADIVARISLASRRRKLDLLMQVLRPTEATTIVDVGAADTGFGQHSGFAFTHNFLEALYPWPHRITAVGQGGLETFAQHFPEVQRVLADGRALPFADRQFDIAFSNAVVEHVGAHEAQEAFAHELSRVARHVFVTTPNRWFPLEVHTLLPFVHWLPARSRTRVFQALAPTRAHDLHPLGPRQLRGLFPFPVRVVNTGLSLVAVGPLEALPGPG